VVPDEPGPGRQPIAKADRDTLITAILTWIPIEVIAAYKFIMGFIPISFPGWRFWISVIVLVLAPCWIAFATKANKGNYAWRQIILAPFAFLCWVAAVQDDVVASLFSGWETWMGSVVLGLGTIALPILDGVLRKSGVTQN
jgi:hypothetical protein